MGPPPPLGVEQIYSKSTEQIFTVNPSPLAVGSLSCAWRTGQRSGCRTGGQFALGYMMFPPGMAIEGVKHLSGGCRLFGPTLCRCTQEGAAQVNAIEGAWSRDACGAAGKGPVSPGRPPPAPRPPQRFAELRGYRGRGDRDVPCGCTQRQALSRPRCCSRPAAAAPRTLPAPPGCHLGGGRAWPAARPPADGTAEGPPPQGLRLD